MEQLLSFLQGFNIQTIVSMGFIVWYFNKDVKDSIDNLDRDIRAMNTRLSRVEGTLYGKDVYKATKEE